MRPFPRNIDVATMQDVTYPFPGSDVSKCGLVTGSWVSPAFDLEDTTNLTLTVFSSGSLSGTLAVQLTTDIGLPAQYNNSGISPWGVGGPNDSLNTQLVANVTGSPGGLTNWSTYQSVGMTSGSSAFVNVANMAARAVRIKFSAGAGPMTGSMLLGMAGYGVKM